MSIKCYLIGTLKSFYSLLLKVFSIFGKKLSKKLGKIVKQCRKQDFHKIDFICLTTIPILVLELEISIKYEYHTKIKFKKIKKR